MIGPDFDHFCALVLARSGLVLNGEKVYLVESRLDPIARSLGFAGVPALLAQLRTRGDEALLRRCVDAMATHESYFFRDGSPFEHLRSTLLGPLVQARTASRTLRIWSAACSSGQEPYSIAILMQEWATLLAGWRIEIVATDMSEPILQKARSGLYSQFEVQRGLSAERLVRWFENKGSLWEVKPALRAMVTFRHHNLLESGAALGVFDIVFCRNVLIYFERHKKSEVLNRLATALAPDGCLFLGSAETVVGLTSSLESIPKVSGVYRPVSRYALAGTA